jgi:porin
MTKTLSNAVSSIIALLVGGQAQAQEAIALDAVYTADSSAALSGGADDKLRYLDNLDLTAYADLDSLVGWKGASAFVYVLNNLGKMPNDSVGSLEGINNIEVGRHGPRLYEAWIEQAIGEHLSVRAGLYDVSSEFNATESASLLIGSAFGTASEIAATGNNGPSIFPSTGLAVRGRAQFGQGGYAQAAVVNADARTWGDRLGGIDTSFNKGVLTLAEAGWGDTLRVSIGGWRYSKRQDHIYDTDISGNPIKAKAHGVYSMIEWKAHKSEIGKSLTFFARGGKSDGKSSPFSGSAQLGVLLGQPVTGRKDSAASFGLHRAWISKGYQQSLLDAGINAAQHETTLEATYSDRLMEHFSIQPDLQYAINSGGDASARDALVATLRLTIDF